MSNMFDYFDNLCARDSARRREGAKNLTSFLQSDSAQSTSYRNMTSFEYSIQRLVKGLSAYHSPTLHGYSTGLVCVLDYINTIKPHDVYSLIEKHLVTPPDARSSEAKGYKVGQLLAVSAVTLSVSFSETDSALKSQVIKLLLSLFNRDSYLKVACTQVMSELISRLSQQELKTHLPLIVTELGSSTILECSPEKLSLLFSICRHYSSIKLANKHVKSLIQIPRLDSQETLAPITDIILQSVSGSYLHPCLPLSIEYFLTKDVFHSFWQTLVEEGLFEMELNRKCTAFDVFYHTISLNPDITQVFSSLSPSLTQLFRSAVHTDREPLHTKCVTTLMKLFSLIHNRVISAAVTLALELCILSPHRISLLYREYMSVEGSDVSVRREDTLVFIHSLLEHFLRGTVLIHYHPVFSRLSDLSTPLLASRDYTLSMVLYLAKQKGEYMTSHTEEAILKFLTTHSYFTLHKSSKSFYPPKVGVEVELSHEVRVRCREVLFLFLTEFLSEETRKLAYFSQLGYAVKWTLSLLDKSSYVSLYSDTDPEMTDLLRGVYPLTVELERELAAGEEVSKYRSNLLSLIHYYCLLLLRNCDKHTKNCLCNLIHCYTAANECTSSVTEIILTTLSHNTHMSRTLAERVFGTMLPILTRDDILLLTDAAFDTEQGEDEGSESENESSENEDSIPSNCSSTSESEEESGDNTDKSVEMRDLLFKKNVLEALGQAGMDQGSDTESLDMDKDEERLKEIDIALSQLFRQKLKTENPKRLERERDISSLHFRIRVLSLVQMFIEKQNDNPLLVYLIVPASECILACSKEDKLKEFFSKLESLFSKKLCASKCKLDTNSDFMCVVFKRVFHLAVSARNLDLSKLISNGVGTVLKAMRRADMLVECSGKLSEIVLECLNHFAEKKHGYQWNTPFLKLIELHPLVACSLIPALIRAISDSSYKFQTRKCEEILQSILMSSHSTEYLHTFIQELHSFYTAKLSMVPSIDNANYCQTVLSLTLPYCQLLAKDFSGECYQEETEQLVDKISETDRIANSQRLSRVCSSLSSALTGSRSRRKRNRRAKGGGNVKRIGLVD